MTTHADILDQPERLRVPFWSSVVLHVTVIGSLAVGTWIQHASHLQMGNPTGGGMGSVMVNPVASIPLPDRGGPQNPVANDTESQVPTPPKAAPKAAPKVKEPPSNAISLKSDKASKRAAPPSAQTNKFREKQNFDQSQLYSNSGPRVSSPLYGISGSGNVGVGDHSPFGSQFGQYATLIQDNVARNWKTADVNARLQTAPAVVITFTIQRDGKVTNVKVAQSSNISPLDLSAMRAVYDAQLPPLPPGFPRDHADVELRFELRR